MKKSITKKSELKEERDTEFANLLKPDDIKPKKIILKRPIYHNGRQYTVKIPREIIMRVGFKIGDMLQYKLVVDPNRREPSLEIKYVRKK